MANGREEILLFEARVASVLFSFLRCGKLKTQDKGNRVRRGKEHLMEIQRQLQKFIMLPWLRCTLAQIALAHFENSI